MDFADLRARLSGRVLEQHDADYEDQRAVFNSMIERRPAAIAQCESTADVAEALTFAAGNGLEVSVRRGGHSVTGAGLTEGGVVIDMRRMNGVSVDPAAHTATVQGGATWADFDRATQPHALMATGGRVSTTGVPGSRSAGARDGSSAGTASPATTCSR